MENYTQPTVKKRRIPVWVWVVGSLLIGSALLGSCVMGGVKVFKSLGERGVASKALATKVMAEGLPDSSDPIWGPINGSTDDFDATADKTSRFYRKFGVVGNIDEPSCGMNSYVGTEQENGTFSTCTMSFQAEKSPGIITVKWKRYDDVWKLQNYHANFSDISALVDDEDDADSAAPTD